MSTHTTDAQRRTLLQLSAGLATAGAGVATAGAAPTGPAGPGAALPKAAPPRPTGKPGDFGFLSGQWQIRNRRLREGQWDEFDSEASVFEILAGVASVEELRIPARNFSGMGLRLLDVERQLWGDYWVNAKGGVLTPPPSWGSFVAGVGTWDADDEVDGKPVIWRGVWDQITPRSCRWFQAGSHDGGRSWQQSWVMQWTRA